MIVGKNHMRNRYVRSICHIYCFGEEKMRHEYKLCNDKTIVDSIVSYVILFIL